MTFTALCRRTGLLLVSLLVCQSSLAPRQASCQLDNIRESAGKFIKSVKENLGPAVKKVTETASDALDMAKKTVSEALGPDLNKNGRESCPKEGCPDESGQQTRGGFSPPPTNKGEPEKGSNEVATVSEDDPGLLKMILGTASTGLATVSRTLYDTMSDMSTRFAETVRKIMNEELHDMIAASMKKIGQAFFTPGEWILCEN